MSMVEPLHLKNNTCALVHRYILNQAKQIRETKHITISKYCLNTVYAHRWEQVFMNIFHEYISLIWLRAHGYTNVSVNSSTGSTLSYSPKRVSSKDPNLF